MSIIRHRSLNRIPSLNKLKKNSNKYEIISPSNDYYTIKDLSISNKIRNKNISRMESLNSNKTQNYKKNINKVTNFSLINVFNSNKNEDKNRFYNPKNKININLIIKNIKKDFISKYNKIYYENNNNILQLNYTTKNLLYKYYILNDILNNKRCHLTVLVKENNLFYDNQELIVRFYKENERDIIIKYLLNFVYKYDELSFERHIDKKNKGNKEKLIRNYFYITSNQYLYKHLLDSDVFKGVKYLLKRINLANKKAQHDYSYLDIARSKILSEENKYIINAIKAINEYMYNRNYLEKRLIKNIPLEKVPNCVPNYYPLGYEFNLSLKNYKYYKKFKKIGKNDSKTLELIKKIEEEYSKSDINLNNDLSKRKLVLFNDIENNNDSDTSDFDNNDNDYKNKSPKRKKNLNYKRFNNILPSSLYKNEDEFPTRKFFFRKSIFGNMIDYKSLYDIFKSPECSKRNPNDPEIIDIEKFLNLFRNNKSTHLPQFKKNLKKTISLNVNRINKYKKELEIENNSNKNDNKSVNDIIKEKPTKSLFFIKNKEEILSNARMKKKQISTNLKLNYNNNNKLKIFINSPKNNDMRKSNRIDKYLNKEKKNIKIKFRQINKNKNEKELLTTSKINNKFSSPKINQKKFDKIFFEKNKMKQPLLLSSSGYNNISSTIFSDSNHLSQNLSFSQKDKDNKVSINETNNNNNLNKLNNKILINKEKYKNFHNKYIFKDTKDFIKGAMGYYNRINIKQKFSLKNLSSSNNFITQKNNSQKDIYPSKKRIFSSSNNNLKRNNEMTIIRRISNYINNQIKQNKSKMITFKEIMNYSEINFLN